MSSFTVVYSCITVYTTTTWVFPQLQDGNEKDIKMPDVLSQDLNAILDSPSGRASSKENSTPEQIDTQVQNMPLLNGVTL